MKNLQNIILLALMLIVCVNVFAEDNNHAAPYIRMGLGARGLGMGSAFTAVANDVTSAYWNPAGLSGLKNIEFASMYSLNMDLDRNYNYAGVGQKYKFGSMAITWINASVTDIEGYSSTDSPTGYFDSSDHNIALSYSTAWQKVNIGMSGKMYYSKIDTESKSGFGLDIGAKYDWNQYMVLGFMARDLYGKIGEDKIPYQFSAGTAIYPFLGLTLAADIRMEHGYDPNVYFGAEYATKIGKDVEADSKLNRIRFKEKNAWQDAFANSEASLRVGFADGHLTAGAGVGFKFIMIDYAYLVSDSDLNPDSHRLSLIIRF